MHRVLAIKACHQMLEGVANAIFAQVQVRAFFLVALCNPGSFLNIVNGYALRNRGQHRNIYGQEF